MRLIEYNAKRFLRDNKYKKDQRKICTQNGFLFGNLEFFNQEFWLERDSDYTDEDFIKAVYELNTQTKDMDLTDLLENLARFLCGYDAQTDCRKYVNDMTSSQQHNYFQNQIENVDSMITDIMISNKINFIKEVLGIS